MSTPLLGKLGALLVVATGSAGVTWVATDSATDVVTNAGPAAWIDDPLDGSVLASDVGEVIVVAHATDPDGIVEIVLTVDGTEVDTAPSGGDDLETADDLRWSPDGPGTYELRAVGRDPSGSATPPGIAIVQVGTDEEQPTTTTTAPDGGTTSVVDDSTSSTDGAGGTTSTTPRSSTSLATSTSVATSTTSAPTTTCVPSTPVNTSPFRGEPVGSRTPTLRWDHQGCTPAQFRVVVTPSRELAPIEAGDTVPGTVQEWTTPRLACGEHWFHVQAVSGPNHSAWSEATQFFVDDGACGR